MKKTLQLVGLVLLSNSLTINLTAQEVCFLPQGSFATGVAPVGITTGDYNNDGNQDIVSANQTGTYSVLLGTGSGSFGVATTTPVGASSYGISTGDFNEDGNDDIVMTHLVMAGTLSVMLGNGDGTFGAATNYLASSVPREIEIEDYNGDGHLDLAVCNTGTTGPYPSLSILFGTGTGTFGVASFYFVAGINGSAYSLVDGDFDNDSDLDIALAVNDTGVVIMANNGAGVFTEGVSYFPLTDFYGIAADDFDSDGDLDIAAADNVLNNVRILNGNGSLIFSDATAAIPVGTGPRSIENADFNNDGNPDLVVSNYGSGNVSVIVGNAAGTFGTVAPFVVESSPNALSVADFNNDNKTDISTINQAAFTSSVLINNAPTITAISSEDTLCIGLSANLTASGGVNYSWNTGESLAMISISPIVDTDYLVIGSDALGCEFGFSITQLTQDCNFDGFGEIFIGNLFVFPNPVKDVFTISAEGLSNDNYNLSIQNIIGEIIFQEKIQVENNALKETVSLNSFPSGIYFVAIGNENSQQTIKLVKE